MNRFLSQDDSNNSNDLNVRTVTVDTSAVTDALTLRADALETSTAALLEYIRILQDVSYTNIAFNAYTESARRAIPNSSYVQISTIDASSSSGGVTSTTSTRILNASGDLVASAVATVNDVWQIVPTGGRDITIASPYGGVDLAQKYGRPYFDILSTDGGVTFHIGQPGPTSLGVWSGSFLTHTDGVATLSITTHTSTVVLAASNRWSLSIVPNYTPPTASELTYQLLQQTFPTVTNGEYEFQIYSYKLQDRYVTYKNMTTYRHFLTIHGGHGVATTYPILNWKLIWDSTNNLFTIRTNDGTEDAYMGRLMQQTDDTYDANPGSYYYADNSLVYSDNFKVEHVTSSTGEHLFKISQGTKSLKY